MDGMPVAAIQPAAATISALLTDHLGTPQIGSNASKITVWTGNYDPNGAVSPTASITMNIRFPGQHADSATGLNYNMFRYYNPDFATGGGRYGQVDPIGLMGGPNPFVYVNNNPYRWIDRKGKGPELILPVVVGLGIVAINQLEEFLNNMGILGESEELLPDHLPPLNFCTGLYPYGIFGPRQDKLPKGLDVPELDQFEDIEFSPRVPTFRY